MKKIISELKKKLASVVEFEKFNFVLFAHSDIDFGYEYHRESEGKTDILAYGFYIDKYKKYSFLSSITYKITFPIVNKILINMTNDNIVFNLNEETIFAVPNIGMQEYTDYHYKQQKLIYIQDGIFNEQIFEEALILFREQLESTVLPFFDKIQTLQQVNDEILEKVDWMEWSHYISGQTIFKALIIMKLCGNKVRYNEFSAFYKDRIKNAIQKGHAEYQNLYNTLIELLNYLDSDKYLEII
jgi:hypothetical protein